MFNRNQNQGDWSSFKKVYLWMPLFHFFIFNPDWVKSANKIYVNYNKILRSRNILSIKNCYFISKLLYCVCTKSKIRGHSKYLEHFLLPICNDYRQRRVEKFKNKATTFSNQRTYFIYIFQFDPHRFFQERNSSVAKFQMLFVFRFGRRFRVECLHYC